MNSCLNDAILDITVENDIIQESEIKYNSNKKVQDFEIVNQIEFSLNLKIQLDHNIISNEKLSNKNHEMFETSNNLKRPRKRSSKFYISYNLNNCSKNIQNTNNKLNDNRDSQVSIENKNYNQKKDKKFAISDNEIIKHTFIKSFIC